VARITLHRGDITTHDVDAVVNAANNGLMGGGGVDGAILRAGGDVQLAARRELRDRIGALPTGHAAATDAGGMQARWVIHVVGPVWSAEEDRTDLLSSCYREALRVADELGARTVAFPAVSAGVYGWPIAAAAEVAVRTVAATPTQVDEARFVLFNTEAYDAFERALDVLPREVDQPRDGRDLADRGVESVVVVVVQPSWQSIPAG
jgi:O-acetyl-ADP-ribose deacetylase (regulator of RNase III)